MLTIKYENPSGYDEVDEALKVLTVSHDGRLCVVYMDRSGQKNLIDQGGNVYVMNDWGRTIATYHLVCPSADNK